MNSFIFALNAVLPLILMVAVGYLLRVIGIIDNAFAKQLNKLVFRVFLPVMLFLNVYNIDVSDGIGAGVLIYAIIALIVIFLLALPTVMLITKAPERRGAMLQASFRSNYALIGVPLAQSLFGNKGAVTATIMLAIVVPLFNVLAVISLSIFSDSGERVSVKKILLGILKNPLIQGVCAGAIALVLKNLLLSQGISFTLQSIPPLAKVLDYLSSLATPLALIALGAQFKFSAVSELRREIVLGTLIHAIIVPFSAIGIAYLLFHGSFSGAEFASLVAMFATPVAVSSVPMAQEMKADVDLAGQLVFWTTVVSAFTIFVISFALSLLGVFPPI